MTSSNQISVTFSSRSLTAKPPASPLGMRPLRLIPLFIFLRLSHELRALERDEYDVWREFKERQPFLHDFRSLPSVPPILSRLLEFQEDSGQATLKRKILYFKLQPTRLSRVFDEALGIIFDSVPDDDFKELLNSSKFTIELYERLIENMRPSKYSYGEFCALLEAKNEINLGNLAFDPVLRDFLIKYPKFNNEGQEMLRHYSTVLRQGFSFGMLNVLIERFYGGLTQITHLSFWTGPAGRWLLRVGKEELRINLSGKYLAEVLSDPVVQEWVFLAYYKRKSMSMVVLMLLFPEKAERIYEGFGLPEDFKSLFVNENLTDWRKEYAEKMNWDEIKWDEVEFREVSHVRGESNQQENERFGLLVHSIRRANRFQQIFQRNKGKFLEEYKRKIFDHDEPAFFYMKLEQFGYPIDKVPNAFDPELESKILQHFEKICGFEWIGNKIIEVLKIYPHSKYIISGKLFMEVSARLKIANSGSLASWGSELAKVISAFIGGCVDFEVPSNRDFDLYKLDEIFEFIIFKEELPSIYPKLVSKLREETDIGKRKILFKILAWLISRCFDGEVSPLHLESVNSLLTKSYNAEKSTFGDWSPKCASLIDGINGIFGSCNPLYVLLPDFKDYISKLHFSEAFHISCLQYFNNYEYTNNLFNDIRSITDHVNEQAQIYISQELVLN